MGQGGFSTASQKCLVLSGAPESKPPFLWDFKTKKIKNADGKKEIHVDYWLIDEKVDIFWEIVNRYGTKKYGYEDIADDMTREGYRYQTRRTEEEYGITTWTVSELINNKIYYTGIWKMKPIKHKVTGEVIQTTVQLPMTDKNGRRLPDLQTWEKLQAIKAERSTFNGTKKHKYLLSGIVRCGLCGKRMSPHPVNRRKPVNGKQSYDLYYYCDKGNGGCGVLIPLEPFEKSVLDMHEYLLKDPAQFVQSAEGNTQEIQQYEEKIRRKEKEKTNIKTDMDSIFNQLKRGELKGEFLKRANEEYNGLAKSIEHKDTEIAELKEQAGNLSKIKAVSSRLSAIVNEMMKAGFSTFDFERKREFLHTLYPFKNEKYHITVWRRSKKEFHWEAKAKFSENSIIGYFHSLDAKGKAIETDVQCIIGREIIESERKALEKYGLADKTTWKPCDIQKVREILKVYSDDKDYSKNTIHTTEYTTDLPIISPLTHPYH